MPLSVLIFHLDSAPLRILYAIACCSGLAAVFLGLGRSRKVTGESADSAQPKQDSTPDTPAPTPSTESIDSTPQVIRLSLPPVAARSTEMSQQEKVAAALMRAGIANTAGWRAPSAPADEASHASSNSDPVRPTTHYIKTSPPKQVEPTPSLGRKLLLIGGALLALVSAYLFLRTY